MYKDVMKTIAEKIQENGGGDIKRTKSHTTTGRAAALLARGAKKNVDFP